MSYGIPSSECDLRWLKFQISAIGTVVVEQDNSPVWNICSGNHGSNVDDGIAQLCGSEC